MIEYLIRIDRQLLVFFNGLHTDFFDPVMYFISAIPPWIPMYVIILFFVFKKQKWYGLITLAALLVLFACTDLISVHGFKNVFHRLRPCHDPVLKDIVYSYKDHCGGLYSFVSSHATNTFGLAWFTHLYFKNKWFSLWIFSWCSVVSLSRVYLGVHFPLDIICGAILGSSLAFIVFYSYKFVLNKVQKPKN